MKTILPSHLLRAATALLGFTLLAACELPSSETDYTYEANSTDETVTYCTHTITDVELILTNITALSVKNNNAVAVDIFPAQATITSSTITMNDFPVTQSAVRFSERNQPDTTLLIFGCVSNPSCFDIEGGTIEDVHVVHPDPEPDYTYLIAVTYFSEANTLRQLEGMFSFDVDSTGITEIPRTCTLSCDHYSGTNVVILS